MPIALYLVWVTMSGRTGMALDSGTAIGPVAASILGGVAIAGTSVIIKRLYDLEVTSGQMLSHRFYLVILVLVVWVDFDAARTVVSDHLVAAVPCWP